MTRVRVPVDVDTRKAKAGIKELNRAKVRATKRVSAAAQRTSRIAARAFAFTGAAATVGKFNNNEPAGNTSVFQEALTPLIAASQQFLDDELGFSAKARRSARERTKAAFAYSVGRTGNTAGMRDFYNTVSKMQTDVESGRNLVRQDPRFLGPDLKTASKAALRGNLELFFKNLNASNPIQALTRGFDYIVDGITAE